jgi:hypothetical protein
MLASMLGVHPDYVVTPETGFKTSLLNSASPASVIQTSAVLEQLSLDRRFLDWKIDPAVDVPPQSPTARELVEWLVCAWARKTGKPAPSLWIDHSPGNIRDAPVLSAHFPDARLVHIVRDGRAVAASARRVKDWGDSEIEPAARTWIDFVAHGLAAEVSGQFLPVERVRYEDVVTDPARVLEQLCTRLDLEYLPEMQTGTGFERPTRLNQTHHFVGQTPLRSRVSVWRDSLSRRDVERFESVAGRLLMYLGYQLEFGLGARRATPPERVISTIRAFSRRRWILFRRRVRSSVGHLRQR